MFLDLRLLVDWLVGCVAGCGVSFTVYGGCLVVYDLGTSLWCYFVLFWFGWFAVCCFVTVYLFQVVYALCAFSGYGLCDLVLFAVLLFVDLVRIPLVFGWF